MPLVRPQPAEGGWWTVVDDKRDDNFVLETTSGISKLSNILLGSASGYRILLRGSNHEIARAVDKDQALSDWDWVQRRYAEEVKLVGSTKFSDHHLLALFEALWEQQHPELAPDKVAFRAFLLPKTQPVFNIITGIRKHLLIVMMLLPERTNINCRAKNLRSHAPNFLRVSGLVFSFQG